MKKLEDLTVEELNGEVTHRILEAERLLKDAIGAWFRVWECEKALSQKTVQVERDLAFEGMGRAHVVHGVLQSLYREADPEERRKSG